ncbi:hypothetical protein BJX70DRAFT_386705 [Aspergillus crustosus]
MADNTHRPRPPPNRRRDKAQLSCDPCRTNSSAACPATAHQPPCRISDLESLVVTLMKGQSLPTPPAFESLIPSSQTFADVFPETRRPSNSQDVAASPADPGTLKLRESGTSYVQSVHWEAILTRIRGRKEDLVSDRKPPPGSHLFYGANRHATRDEILAAVPPRPVVDRLMALHFDSDIITPYQYESFWEDPSVSPVAWVGLMFSMLYIAAQLQIFTIDLSDGQAVSLKVEYLTVKDVFREKAGLCLILARYTTGGPYILETLIMVLNGEFVLLRDSATDGWLLISTTLHLAIRMGYHRDPDHFPGISPFEAEMRRRIWTTILVLDLALFLEMGLPRSATVKHIDTKQPRNLHDCDFDEDTSEMPPPRPEIEWTPALPLIARARLISALGLICDINSDIDPPSYEAVIKADALLQDVHKRAIPPVLRWETMPHPITDSPNLVVQRPEGRDRDSVRICLDSALKILSFQQMLHEESQPFGRLCQLRWKVTHIFNQDVLLATSVLCLYLQDIDKFELSEPAEAGHPTPSPSAAEIRQRLTISHKIWHQVSTASPEAGKVAEALSIILGHTETETPVTDGAFSGFYSPLSFFDNVLEARGA